MNTKWIKITALFLLITSANIYAADTTHCLSQNIKLGDNCGSSDSKRVEVTNNCDQNVYVKICLERINGTWDCGSDSSLKPVWWL